MNSQASPMSSADTRPAGRSDAAAPAAPGANGARLLAIASSGAWTSVALLRADAGSLECDCIAEPSGPEQSASLLTLIGEVLGPAGFGAVSAIAFDAGPGAFTGLRIGCSVAQGLGFARNLPLVAVCSLEAAAWRSLRLLDAAGAGAAAGAVVRVANDARMGELYAALLRVRAPTAAGQGPRIDVLVEPMLAAPDVMPAQLSAGALARSHPELAGLPWLPAGDAWGKLDLSAPWYETLSGDLGARPGLGAGGAAARFAQSGDARAVAEIGWSHWCQGRAVSAEHAAPRYVRDKVALDIGEQRRLREQREAAR
jgi:tRNA threonylcarbamoyladenosine biosynthesis protein TsaB